jgi:threonyl-tRNA synthetase
MENILSNNDHRRIGRDLKLFHLQEDAAGSVFWHPRGYALFNAIESYLRTKLRKAGYQEVKTPQLIDKSLWEKSGHWDKFKNNMYVLDDDQRQFAIKPMNCPGHVQIFNSDVVSYRQLPMRLAEFGCCHRSEPSGALHGIMRVRQFTQDDAHIFCEPTQVVSEVKEFVSLLKEVYRDFGFDEVVIGLSTRPEIRAGSEEDWGIAERNLAEAVKAAGLEFNIQEGEGAFYGPKLEFALRDIKGRQWQCGTIQLDMVLPKRLGAKYVAQDGSQQQPVMLHRAILGSLERFIGILLEHYEGNLPAWLAPENMVIIPLAGAEGYAQSFRERIEQVGGRVVWDDRDENLKQKIKEHSELKRPYIVVIGPRDGLRNEVSVRKLGADKAEALQFDYFVEQFASEMKS